jgi:hypothetical protein
MKNALLAFTAICLLAACKKDNSNSSDSPHITTTISGTAKAFNVSPIATKMSMLGYTSITVTGLATASAASELISLAIAGRYLSQPIGVGTYTDTSSVFAVSAVYSADLSTQYVGNNEITKEALRIGSPIVNHLKIVIASIDSVAVKGTFSGDVLLNGKAGSPAKTLTNGDFYAKFKTQ